MAAIVPEDAKEIKEGIVNIHKLLELRKLHINRLRTGRTCGVCQSFCRELGLQKQTKNLIEKHSW
jgi:hypothetical protein